MLAITELTWKNKTGRRRKSLSPSVRDINLLLSVCQIWFSGDRIGNKNLFQPSKQTGWFDVIL